MPGYDETYLEGLQNLASVAMNQRRLDQAMSERQFNDRLHAQNLQRQYEVLNSQNQYRARLADQFSQQQGARERRDFNAEFDRQEMERRRAARDEQDTNLARRKFEYETGIKLDSRGNPVEPPKPQAEPPVPQTAVPEQPQVAAPEQRDLMDERGTQVQPYSTVPQPAPQAAQQMPSQASPAQPAAPAPVQMPPEIAAAPKAVQNKWLLKNAPTSGSAAMNEDAIKVAGWEKLLFGTDPKGMGSASAQQRAQIANERVRLGKALGLSETEMAMMPQDNKVKMKAVDKLTTWGAFVDKAADQILPSIDLAISYAQKMNPTMMQALNKAIIAGRTEFNDPTANAYALAVNTVRREYGRLMSGPTSNAMLPVEAMKKGDELISNALNIPAWREVKNAIVKDAGFTREAVQGQIRGLRSSITNVGKGGAETPTEAAAAKPLAGMTNAELARRREELIKQRRGHNP